MVRFETHGRVNDSYICSNERMRNAYRKRPQDFTRSVLEYVYVDCAETLLRKEQSYLDQVHDIRNNDSYYNIKNEAKGGWSFINTSHIAKRTKTLKEKHSKHGLSESERNSYRTKLESRFSRWETRGFSQKEKNQHRSYGVKVLVTFPDGKEKTYYSLSEASRETSVDIMYAEKVTKQGKLYKGYKATRLKEPEVDCRSFKTQ